MTNENLKHSLSSVYEICIDGYKGYQTAAENLEDKELTTVFNRLSQQRKLFAEEIKDDARRSGHEIESTGSIAGFFHRTWIDVKDAFSTTSNQAVIDASITGEKKAVETYEEAISSDMPAPIKERLEKHLQLVNGALRQLQEMEAHAN